MMDLIGLWIAFSLSVFIVAQVLPTVKIKGCSTALWVALVYGLLKFLLYRLLVFLSLPLIAVTFGLFLIVVNAFLLWLTDRLVSGFKIKSFGHALIASVLISLIDVGLRWVWGVVAG